METLFPVSCCVIISVIKNLLKSSPRITILGEMARVHLFLHRSVTLVKIINCIKKPKKCLETNVTVPHDTDPGMLLTRDFTTTIDLVDTDAKKWVFYIWKYKDAELVNSDPDEVEVDIPNCK